jgi:hypothetical protein
MKQLTARHLASHGLEPEEYKKKYGFSDRNLFIGQNFDQGHERSPEKMRIP